MPTAGATNTTKGRPTMSVMSGSMPYRPSTTADGAVMIAAFAAASSGQPVKTIHASAAPKVRFERRYESLMERLGGSMA